MGVSDGAAGPDRRQVLSAGAAGIATVVLPAAAAAATAAEPLTFSGTLTFSDVSDTGFTVSWTGV